MSKPTLTVCTPKTLPSRLLVRAAETARSVSPQNAPARIPPRQQFVSVLDPQQIAVLTTKYWGPAPRTLSVSFLERTASDLQRRILSHMNAWASRCGISFSLTAGTGTVRISLRGDGYWSYLGTDVLHIPRNRPTMNLQGFSMRTPEGEYRRVVRHEVGHTMGFPHEHMRREIVQLLDPQKTIRWMAQNYGWDQQTVTEQVLTPLDDASIMGTPPDQDSIMCYQLSGACTRSGEPIPGGLDINESDYAFAERIYPRAGRLVANLDEMADREPDAVGMAPQEDDWPESEDPEPEIETV
jgi:hypothetical protein